MYVLMMTINRLQSCFLFSKVIRRLRERGEPIRVFGESDEEACQRLRLTEDVVFVTCQKYPSSLAKTKMLSPTPPLPKEPKKNTY